MHGGSGALPGTSSAHRSARAVERPNPIGIRAHHARPLLREQVIVAVARLIEQPGRCEDEFDGVVVPESHVPIRFDVAVRPRFLVQVQVAAAERVLVDAEPTTVLELHLAHPHERTAKPHRQEPLERAPVRLLGCPPFADRHVRMHEPNLAAVALRHGALESQVGTNTEYG
jgi:hypothetical protein